MRVLCTCLVATFLGATVAGADGLGPTVTRVTSDIPPQSVSAALNDFSNQTGLQHIFFAEIAEDRRSKGVRAGVALTDALSQLLDGTGLKFEYLNPRLVKIYAAEAAPVTVVRDPETLVPLEADGSAPDRGQERSLWSGAARPAADRRRGLDAGGDGGMGRQGNGEANRRANAWRRIRLPVDCRQRRIHEHGHPRGYRPARKCDRNLHRRYSRAADSQQQLWPCPAVLLRSQWHRGLARAAGHAARR